MKIPGSGRLQGIPTQTGPRRIEHVAPRTMLRQSFPKLLPAQKLEA
jgi:hypothetical protein